MATLIMAGEGQRPAAHFKPRRTIRRVACNVRSMKLHIFCIALLSLTVGVRGADPFAENVRTTEPNAPAAEAKLFHLPDGFEITLVASEPDIGKPMNLAFDSRGRLWVT